MDSQNFLALNAQNSPGSYTNLPRPISAANASELGMFDNGLNCGRWVQVTIGNYCTGVNDGAPGAPFCRNGSWVSDQYNGATLVSIGAIQGAQPYWSAIAISHLANGIHAVQYFANGAWSNATMDSDQGDDYIIAPTTGAGTAGSQYEIRVTDASGNLVSNGEVYNFTLPAACLPNGCQAPYTPVSYTTSSSPAGPPPPPPPSGGSCTLASTVTNSWPGGYQLQLTVTSNGTAPLTGWTAGFMFGDTTETIASSWSATVTQSGRQVTAASASYNGSVAAGGSASFGMVINGSSQALSGLTCSPALVVS